ncbi:MAG: hypothetical protein MK212_19555 [Saprospiraceae bacterium]|nr:hypothetical protein [Saprospiraceae bacterium]
MKKLSVLVSALFGLSLLSSCVKDKCTQEVTYMKDIPVYMTTEEIRQPIETEGPRALENPGKIYLYADYVLVNEVNQGVHIIDNSNPSNPKNISFIKIPGNVDIAMKGSVLYADNYMDLLAIDLSNPNSATMLKRVESVFPTFGVNPDNENELLVRYRQEEVTETVDCDWNNGWNGGWGGGGIMEDAAFTPTNTATGGTGGVGRSAGIGGSMARFAITGDYLYAVDNQDLHVISILSMDDPTEINRLTLTTGTETIFPHEDKLFIGGNTGMDIYDCGDPTNPSYLSRFEHAFACDPVFVDGDFAYITLRQETVCQTGWNQLQVVDISTITAPNLISTYTMENPHGLSVRDEVLYLCEGDFGLKTFDVTDKLSIDQNQLSQIETRAYDVIAVPHTDRILLVGDDGFYQYDITSPSNLQLISKIEVNK